MSGRRIHPKSPHAADPLRTGEDALAWAISADATQPLVAEIRRRASHRRRRRYAAFGSAAIFTILIGATLWGLRIPEATTTPTALTSNLTSLPSRQVLADGSVVELKQGAELEIDFSSGFRRVALLKGEAHFEVAHDTARPFIVSVNRLQIRAVGTAFLVSRAEARVDVLVTEGRVALSKSAAGQLPVETPEAELASPLATLDAGFSATIETDSRVTPTPEIAAVSASEQAVRLSWRVPRLEFSDTPLLEAVAMFNQHSPVRLTLDPAFGDLRMSGTLRADDIDSLLLLLKNEFGITGELRSSREIVLRRL